jgi:uncharacterized tellurite resistance protein B-like protein
MLNALRKLFDENAAARTLPGHERRHLQVAAASLLHDATRADLAEHPQERAAAVRALQDLFELDAQGAAAVLEQGREKAQQQTSYFAVVSVIKRDFGLPERVRLIEHLWRIAYADGRLDPYEDHYVRKIAHLLYVPNTESMVARNRARSGT